MSPGTRQSKVFTWADLPPDIVFKILEEIAKDRSGYDQTSSLVLLRLVSKSWKAAVAAYPARLACYAVCLPAVCKLFPKMANATILLVNDSTSVRLAPLAQCSQLSSVTLASRATDPKRVLLQDLPPSVRKLQLRGLLVDEICLGEASHLPITHFTVFSGSVADLSDLTALPEKLPFIQELCVSGQHPGWVAQNVLSTMARLTALTSLSIANALFEVPAEQAEVPRALLKLDLDYVCWSGAWLDSFLPQLTKLTELKVSRTKPLGIEAFPDEPPQVVEQELGIFCRLPSPNLPPPRSLREVSLKFDASASWDKHLHAPEIQYLANLPALTELELSGMAKWADLQPLRQLPLLHLRLYHCELAELNLLVPDALTSLTELRIFTRQAEGIDDFQQLMLPYSSIGFPAGKALSNVCTNILNLPHLQKLAVAGPLYRIGLRDRLQPYLNSGRFVKCAHGVNEVEEAMLQERMHSMSPTDDITVLQKVH